MNINDAFPSKYLRASDLNDSEPVVTIERVVCEPVGQEKLMKPVAYFQGKEKGLVINKTNGKVIEMLSGSEETDDWVGTQVMLYTAMASYQGRPVNAIRLKSPQKTRKAAAPVPAAVPAAVPVPDDDIPFAWLLPYLLPVLMTGGAMVV